MAGSPPPPLYSPDGKFYWDGTAWRPVPQQPGAPQHHGPPQPGDHAQAPSPPAFGPPPGQPGGGPWAFPPPPAGAPSTRSSSSPRKRLVGTLVAAILAGAAVGGQVGLTVTEPEGSKTPHPVPAAFPRGDQQYLRGVTVTLVSDSWLVKANSWTCADDPDVDGLYSGAKRKMVCWPRGDAEDDMDVAIEYDEENKVKVVRARCRLGTDNPVCTSLFASMAHTLLSSQKDVASEGETWAKENAGSEEITTIGGIRFAFNLEPNGLEATPGV
ncbi:hypothetical protein [Thermasporomyces composti]|uniref:DUF2510 domain-containing protein n=1 Tax=Thermasporomyces composti TaxID=696763 RepID=A0A3D9VCE4_THECX|nr:hypothetical protein [Thermasporomyces composti]REF37850.1 hypothetical protein DFJ64_3311 [Thermasporomyces composti]